MVSRRSRWRPKDSRPCVRPYMRTYVTLLLENRSLLFSETLQLVRACKREKNVPNAFLIIFTVLAKNWPKLAIWLDVWKSPFKGWKSWKKPESRCFLSLDEVVGNLRIHVRACVRTCVRMSRCCSKTVHYFFLKLCS